MPGKAILVIDDDTNVGSTLSAILRQAGYRVVSARVDGDPVVNLKGDCFDLIILDMKMPDHGVMKILSKLNLLYPGLPVIVMTAYSSLDLTNEVDHSKVMRILLKPVDPVNLLKFIKETLSGSESF